MNVSPSVAQLQREHVVMELECIDRMYLNAYIPKLTSEAGIAGFLRGHLGHRFASTKQAGEMTAAFIRRIREFLKENEVPLVPFKKGQRKDDVFKKHLKRFKRSEGVVFVGVAQEKARVPRTIRKRFGEGGSIPWIDYTTAMVNFYYFYCVDENFGPFFIKFCSYFPYFAKICINGHEYLKCQLTQEGIPFEALDNGLLSCENLPRTQTICDHLDAAKIDRLFRKWLALLPHPYSSKDRAAGYGYDLSILQAEFSLTQIWDRGVRGRCFFEEVIRENIDLGRPEQIQLIFGRKLRKSTVAAGRCRTRILSEGVIPSLHVYYKNTHLKQYHKEGRGLRTETTINDTYDFGVGRRLRNLPQLREIAFPANRRVLEVETISHDCNVPSLPTHRSGFKDGLVLFANIWPSHTSGTVVHVEPHQRCQSQNHPRLQSVRPCCGRLSSRAKRGLKKLTQIQQIFDFKDSSEARPQTKSEIPNPKSETNSKSKGRAARFVPQPAPPLCLC
jgi:hypothetical protein